MKNGSYRHLVFIFLILTSTACAGQAPKFNTQGSRAYKKLIETQQDYAKAVASGDSSQIAEMCYRMGKRYMGINNLYKSREWLLRSLRLRTPRGTASEDIGKIYTRLFELEIWANHPNKVMEYARMAVKNFNLSNSEIGKINGYRMLAGAHHCGWKARRKNVDLSFSASLDSTFFYYDLALREAENQRLPLDIALTYECMSDALGENNDLKNQLLYRELALNIYQTHNLPYNAIAVSTAIANSFVNRDKFPEASKWINRIKHLSAKTKDVDETQQLATAQLLAAYFERLGDWKSAFVHKIRADNLMIKQLEAYQEGIYEGMNTLLAYEKSQAEVKSQKLKILYNEQNAKLQLWVNGLTALLLLSAISAVVFFYRKSNRYVESTNINAELVREQSHRVFNNLQSVSDLIALHMENLSDPSAKKALEESLLRIEAICLVHKNLYTGNNQVELNLAIFIPELILNVLRTYNLGLTRTFFEIEDVALHIDKAIPLGLIVNELTTNSCKYALTGSCEPWLSIKCFVKNDTLTFIYMDSGPMYTPISKEQKRGFGYSMIDLLAKGMKGRYLSGEGNRGPFKLSFEYKKDSYFASKKEKY